VPSFPFLEIWVRCHVTILRKDAFNRNDVAKVKGNSRKFSFLFFLVVTGSSSKNSLLCRLTSAVDLSIGKPGET
jgi:hypothetical protein